MPNCSLSLSSSGNLDNCYTQTGINASVKLNDQWSILAGIHAGDDIAPWNRAAHPTGIFMVLIILALLAIGTYNLMARLEKRLLHWQGEPSQI